MTYERLTLFALLMAVFGSSVSAKRTAPKPVQSIISDGIEYRAPLDLEKMGVVQAWDVKTKKMLWEKKVYSVRFNPLLERDAQWIFITHLKAEAGLIVVSNEKGKQFSLSPKSKRVRKLRASNSAKNGG